MSISRQQGIVCTIGKQDARTAGALCYPKTRASACIASTANPWATSLPTVNCQPLGHIATDQMLWKGKGNPQRITPSQQASTSYILSVQIAIAAQPARPSSRNQDRCLVLGDQEANASDARTINTLDESPTPTYLQQMKQEQKQIKARKRNNFAWKRL